jgi:hypothetical protein
METSDNINRNRNRTPSPERKIKDFERHIRQLAERSEKLQEHHNEETVKDVLNNARFKLYELGCTLRASAKEIEETTTNWKNEEDSSVYKQNVKALEGRVKEYKNWYVEQIENIKDRTLKDNITIMESHPGQLDSLTNLISRLEKLGDSEEIGNKNYFQSEAFVRSVGEVCAQIQKWGRTFEDANKDVSKVEERFLSQETLRNVDILTQPYQDQIDENFRNLARELIQSKLDKKTGDKENVFNEIIREYDSYILYQYKKIQEDYLHQYSILAGTEGAGETYLDEIDDTYKEDFRKVFDVEFDKLNN